MIGLSTTVFVTDFDQVCMILRGRHGPVGLSVNEFTMAVRVEGWKQLVSVFFRYDCNIIFQKNNSDLNLRRRLYFVPQACIAISCIVKGTSTDHGSNIKKLFMIVIHY